MTTDTPTDLQAHVDAWCETLELPFAQQCEDGALEAYADAPEWQRQDAARESFEAGILEAYCDVRMSTQFGTLQHVGLLLTFGGPNVRAEIDPDDGRMVIRGAWWNESATAYGTASEDVREWCQLYADDVRETSGAF